MLVHNFFRFFFARSLATEHATNRKVNSFMIVDASYWSLSVCLSVAVLNVCISHSFSFLISVSNRLRTHSCNNNTLSSFEWKNKMYLVVTFTISQPAHNIRRFFALFSLSLCLFVFRPLASFYYYYFFFCQVFELSINVSCVFVYFGFCSSSNWILNCHISICVPCWLYSADIGDLFFFSVIQNFGKQTNRTT